MKYQDAYEKVKKYIISGALGKSGTRLISTQELSKLCEISFVNTLKIVHALKEELYLVSIHQKLYIANGSSEKNSDLRKTIGNSKKIGILIPSVTNPFFAELTENLSKNLQQQGYAPIFYIYNEHIGREVEGLKFFLTNQCEGVIFLVANPIISTIETFNRFPLPFVTLGKTITNLKSSSISSENYTTSVYVAKRLIENGYTHLIFLQSHKTHENSQRLLGFLDGAKLKNVNMDNLRIIQYDPTDKRWKRELSNYIDKLEKDCSVGIFCYHDLIAFDAFFYLTNAGYNIPERVGIIGYDDLPIAKTFNISTCTYSYNDMVKHTIACLLEKLNDSLVADKDIKVQTILTLRKSTK